LNIGIIFVLLLLFAFLKNRDRFERYRDEDL